MHVKSLKNMRNNNYSLTFIGDINTCTGRNMTTYTIKILNETIFVSQLLKQNKLINNLLSIVAIYHVILLYPAKKRNY